VDEERAATRDEELEVKTVHKPITGIVAVSMLIIAFGYCSRRQSEEALRESIVRAAFDVADQTLAEIDRHFSDRVTHGQVYSKTLAVGKPVEESNRAFAALTDVQAHIDKIASERRAVRNGQPISFMQRLMEAKDA